MVRFDKKDRQALGGLGGAILLVVLVVLIIIGATVAIPFVGQQTVKEGDYLIYSVSGSQGNTSTMTLVFMEVGASTMEVAFISSEEGDSMVDSMTCNYEHIGNVLQADILIGSSDPFFILPVFIGPDDLSEFDSSAWVAISGFTPMLVQKYKGESGGLNYTVMMKMGTNLIVGVDFTDGSDWIKIRLVDSNIMWVKAA